MIHPNAEEESQAVRPKPLHQRRLTHLASVSFQSVSVAFRRFAIWVAEFGIDQMPSVLWAQNPAIPRTFLCLWDPRSAANQTHRDVEVLISAGVFQLWLHNPLIALFEIVQANVLT